MRASRTSPQKQRKFAKHLSPVPDPARCLRLSVYHQHPVLLPRGTGCTFSSKVPFKQRNPLTGIPRQPPVYPHVSRHIPATFHPAWEPDMPLTEKEVDSITIGLVSPDRLSPQRSPLKKQATLPCIPPFPAQVLKLERGSPVIWGEYLQSKPSLRIPGSSTSLPPTCTHPQCGCGGWGGGGARGGTSRKRGAHALSTYPWTTRRSMWAEWGEGTTAAGEKKTQAVDWSLYVLPHQGYPDFFASPYIGTWMLTVVFGANNG